MSILEKAVHIVDRVMEPEDTTSAPEGVLLYSPTLLRLVAICTYAIFLLAFLNNFLVSDFFRNWFPGQEEMRLFYGQLVLVVMGAIGVGAVVIFARRYYKGAMLAATMFSISTSMIASAYMYGLDVNPHQLLVLVPLLVVGFAVGRSGLVLSVAWIIVMYVFLWTADELSWWPRPTNININIVKHENFSTLVIMLVVLLATQFYLLKIGMTLRKQGQLYGELQDKEHYQEYLLSRIMTVQDEERKRIARDLHDAPLQEMFVVGRALNTMRQDISDLLAGCEDALLGLNSDQTFTASEGSGSLSRSLTNEANPHAVVLLMLHELQAQLGRLIGDDTIFGTLPSNNNGPPGDSRSTLKSEISLDVRPTIEDVIVQVRSVTEHMREICANLHPTYLDDPLLKTLRNSINRLRSQNPDIGFEMTIIGTEPSVLRDDVKVTCKHILEEAVHNALVHASARHILINLSFLPDGTITLHVSNDGLEFEVRPLRQFRASGHHGLANMQERAELVGGQLQIESMAGRGTLVRLIIPSRSSALGRPTQYRSSVAL